MVIQAPMSFAGSAKRIWNLTRLTDNPAGRAALAIPVALLVVVAWIVVAVWYVITLVLFGILLIPYRLVRRGSRKRKADEVRHREALAAIERKQP